MSQSFNYRHLYYFWVVAKEGGSARAAERLDMAVQTISAQVRELEKALGVSLLRSEGRNLVLTDAGVAAMHEADQIFALGEQLPHRVREAAAAIAMEYANNMAREMQPALEKAVRDAVSEALALEVGAKGLQK